MMINVVIDDLVTYIKEEKFDRASGFPVVLHGCNCYCVMGAGVALALSNEWPEISNADKQTSPGDNRKLGNWTTATLDLDGGTVLVHNIYSQFRYGPAVEKNFDLDAFDRACQSLASYYKNQNVNFIFPLIGAGNAGGNWSDISDVIVNRLSDFNLTLVRQVGPTRS